MNMILTILTTTVLCASPEVAVETSGPDIISNQEIASEWVDCGTVTLVKWNGSIRISNQTPRKVQQDSNSGRLRIYYGGEWYNVRSSNRSGYDYMFSAGGSTWYFNL